MLTSLFLFGNKKKDYRYFRETPWLLQENRLLGVIVPCLGEAVGHSCAWEWVRGTSPVLLALLHLPFNFCMVYMLTSHESL